MRSSVLVLGIFSGSWGISLTGFLARERRYRGWPSVAGSGASSVAGSGDPSVTDAAAALEKTKSGHSVVPGVYLIVYKPKKLLLDTFAVPQGTLGQHGEAVLKQASATMTQEWVILPVKNVPEEEYTIQNRATGENLQPPGAEGIEVQSGVKKGGWKVTEGAGVGAGTGTGVGRFAHLKPTSATPSQRSSGSVAWAKKRRTWRAVTSSTLSPPTKRTQQIGRASCRERV